MEIGGIEWRFRDGKSEWKVMDFGEVLLVDWGRGMDGIVMNGCGLFGARRM